MLDHSASHQIGRRQPQQDGNYQCNERRALLASFGPAPGKEQVENGDARPVNSMVDNAKNQKYLANHKWRAAVDIDRVVVEGREKIDGGSIQNVNHQK